MVNSFNPVAGPNSHILVLGTVPGRESLRLNQYYANPRNAFWRIMGNLFDFSASLAYQDRLDILTNRGVALWDVLASANLQNTSLDSKIVRGSETPNDIADFLHKHPFVTHVLLNGSKAGELFARHVESTLPPGTVTVHRLPSTSPANTSLPYEVKLSAWKKALRPLDPLDRFTWHEGDLRIL